MSKLTDKYTIKRNKIRNQLTLLRGQAEGGVVFFLDKVEGTINAYDNLLLTWRTHSTPLGDRRVRKTMYTTVNKILEENRTMERKLEHRRYPDLPYLYRKIP